MSELLNLVAERQKRQEHYARYQPGEVEGWNQKCIHESSAPTLLIFGGNRSGKSHCATMELIWRLTGKHPYKKTPPAPITAWVISTEYLTIRNGIYAHILTEVPEWHIQSRGPRVQGHDLHSYILFKNGSRVEFISAKGREDARQKLQAAQVDVISIDEEVAPEVIEELNARQWAVKNPVKIISATLVMSEPWVMELEAQAESGDPNICMTRLDTLKSPHVNTEAVQRDMLHMDAETIEYRIHGKSRRFSGLVYKEFNERHTTNSFPIPQTWPRYNGIDPGIRTCGVLWVAIDPDGRKIVYDELYLHGVALHEVVQLIRIKEGWVQKGTKKHANTRVRRYIPGPKFIPMQCRVIDDKKGARTLTGEWGPLESLAILYGIHCTPAIKGILAGVERCRQALAGSEPETLVFKDKCPKFLREIQNYRYPRDKTSSFQNAAIQKPLKKNDHLMDPWRYILMLEPEYEKINAPETLDPDFYEDTEDLELAHYRARAQYKRDQDTGRAPCGHPVAGVY